MTLGTESTQNKVIVRPTVRNMEGILGSVQKQALFKLSHTRTQLSVISCDVSPDHVREEPASEV